MSDQNAPATKADLAQLRAELEQRFEQRFEQHSSEANHRFDELMEAMRDGQTELLKAFYNFAQTNDARVEATESDTAGLKKRLAILESRMKEVEIRLNMPPAA